MPDTPYSKFDKEKLILRDHLAIDRTILANERTLLAYIRTALTLFVAGVTFIQFFASGIIQIVGWIFLPSGVATFIIGLIRHRKMGGAMRIARESGPASGTTE